MQKERYFYCCSFINKFSKFYLVYSPKLHTELLKFNLTCGISFLQRFLKVHTSHLIIQNSFSQPFPFRLLCGNIRGIIAECSWRKQRQHEAAERKSKRVARAPGTTREWGEHALYSETPQQLHFKSLLTERFEEPSLLSFSYSIYWELLNPTFDNTVLVFDPLSELEWGGIHTPFLNLLLETFALSIFQFRIWKNTLL